MKLYSTLYACFNKMTIIVVTLFVFVTTANASGLPVKTSATQYNLNALDTNAPGVIYASIDAVANDKSVIVKWVTASEYNNSHFEVERSFDMKLFKTVALILDGFAAEGTGKAYAYKEGADEVKSGKTVYFRLKQINEDGKVSYSMIMAVKSLSKITSSTNTTMLVSPNPVADNLSIQVNSAVTGLAEIRIVSLGGQILLSKQSTISKGYSNVVLEGFNKLKSGIYMTQLIMNGTVIDNQKLIKE